MNCCDYYDKEDSKRTDNDGLKKELGEIRFAITALGYEIDAGMEKAYRQGFIDGYELGTKSIED